MIKGKVMSYNLAIKMSSFPKRFSALAITRLTNKMTVMTNKL